MLFTRTLFILAFFFFFDRAASESLERCRSQAEKTADRTTAAVDAWLAERRLRWEAGKTRCQELAPPPPPPLGARGGGGGAFGGVSDGSSAAAAATPAGGAGMGVGVGGGGVSSWNWERGPEGGAGFDDFFATFAGGGEGVDGAGLGEAAEQPSGA